MVGILTIFGVIWIFQGIRDFFMTEKFAESKKKCFGTISMGIYKGTW